MAKLGNIFKGNVLVLTQSPHGALQNNRAIDCVAADGSRELIAPCDVEIKATRKDQFNNAFFEAFNNNFKIQFVHAYGVTPGKYKEGSVIGLLQDPKESRNSTGYHVHVSIQVAGTWYVILDFMDRSIQLKQAPHLPWRNWHWQNWSSWADRQLSIINMFGEPKPPANLLEKQIQELTKKFEAEKKAIENQRKIDVEKLEQEKQVLDNKILELRQEMQSLAPVEETDTTNLGDFIKSQDFDVDGERFKFTRENGEKVLRGAGIAAAGAVLAYFGGLLELYDFGEVQAIAAWLLPTLVNALREFSKRS